MNIWILTICPEVFQSFLDSHLIARGREREELQMHVVDLRDFVPGCFRKVDDSPYGGGAGLVLRCAPVVDALRWVREKAGMPPGSQGFHSLALTPAGRVFRQADARRYAGFEHLVMVCGHYEGMDERISSFVDEELSIGDFVLSGGELAAMVVADAVSRLLEGQLKDGSLLEESFDNDRLEYPQYTRPAQFEGLSVPPVLLSGDHGAIARYRKVEALRRTIERRPDLLERTPLTEEEKGLLGS